MEVSQTQGKGGWASYGVRVSWLKNARGRPRACLSLFVHNGEREAPETGSLAKLNTRDIFKFY